MEIKHIIISRCKFLDKELMNKYLIITKNILIPSLKSQINKNFKWGLIINRDDVDYVKNFLNIDFIDFNDLSEYKKYVIENNYNIQTRHDIDDWMSKDYIDIIQKNYKDNINKWDNFLIQTQPLKLDYNSNIETKLSKYTNNRNSMHLSLCQKNCKNLIFDRKHGQMWEISNNVITLPEGYTKWVIHGNNISVKKKMI